MQNGSNTFANQGELFLNGGWPLSLNFTIPKDAISGDYIIHMVLFYKNGDKWYSSMRDVPIHINAWYEWDPLKWLLILPVISILLQYWNICIARRNRK